MLNGAAYSGHLDLCTLAKKWLGEARRSLDTSGGASTTSLEGTTNFNEASLYAACGGHKNFM
jgi:hypothetical protein